MADILGTGTSYNIKGKSGYFYEGLLFDKGTPRKSLFGSGKHYLIDVIEYNDFEVTKYKPIAIFEDEELPEEIITGDKYFVLETKPRFGRLTASEEFPM